MRAGIHAAREAADDYQAAIGQVSGEALRHLIPVGGGTSRADDGNLVAIQKFNISADIEKRRRVVNLAQALGVFGLVPGEQADSGGLRLGEFLGGGAERLARVDGLRYGGGQAMRFQFGERSAENAVGAAHRGEKFSGHARAEAGSQRERQPSQVLVGVHRG